jgi:hypothetical protein
MDDETLARIDAEAEAKARKAGPIGAEAVARLRAIIHAHRPPPPQPPAGPLPSGSRDPS